MSWSDASMRRALAALLVAGSLATWAGGAQAGDDLWTTQGPISGNISGLAIDPTTPAILYAGAFGLGVFKSPNSGQTWGPVNNGLTGRSIGSLAIDPVTPATVYAAAGGRQVFKTLDEGASWNEVGAGLPTSSAEPGIFISVVAVDPGDAEHGLGRLHSRVLLERQRPPLQEYLWRPDLRPGARVPARGRGRDRFRPSDARRRCTRQRPVTAPPVTTPRCFPGTVRKSTDGGLTWARTSLTAFVNSLVIDPATPANLYAGALTIVESHPGIPVSCSRRRARRGECTGARMAARRGGAARPPTGQLRALAIDPVTPSTVYAGTSFDGIFKSVNGGLTFSVFSPGLPRGAFVPPPNFSLGHVPVSALVVNPLDPAVVHAATATGVFDIEQRPPSFDSDARTDLAVFRTTTGEWFIKHSSDGGVVAKEWGAAALGDVPVPADYDGDGRLDVAVYRTGTGQWFVFQSTDGTTVTVAFGIGGDVPLAADYDGDGKARHRGALDRSHRAVVRPRARATGLVRAGGRSA